MLLSSYWRPHGVSKVGSRKSWESRRAPSLNHFQKLPPTSAEAMNLVLRGLKFAGAYR